MFPWMNPLDQSCTLLDRIAGDANMAELQGITLQLHVHRLHIEGVKHSEIALAAMTCMKALDSLISLQETFRHGCNRPWAQSYS